MVVCACGHPTSIRVRDVVESLFGKGDMRGILLYLQDVEAQHGIPAYVQE
jgi:hypothetical protein